MVRSVVIVHSETSLPQTLHAFFTMQGDKVWQATSATEARFLIKKHKPDLLVIDIHLPDIDWQRMLSLAHRVRVRTGVLLIVRHADPQREDLAQTQGLNVCVRLPCTRGEIEQALAQVERSRHPSDRQTSGKPARSRLRVPVRIKITLPYVLLALFLALAATYVVSQVALDSIEERFVNQLIEAGKQSADEIVREESRLLTTLRLIAYVEAMPAAVETRDVERLRLLTLPIVVNAGEEAVDILDREGNSLLSLRYQVTDNQGSYTATQGDEQFRQWPLTQRVLRGERDPYGDKYASLVQLHGSEPAYYLYVAGPINDERGELIGVVLVGKRITTLVQQFRQETLAHTTVYNLAGEPIASTLPDQPAAALLSLETARVLEQQESSSRIRPVVAGSIPYYEIMGPFEVRNGNDLGLLGTALPQTFLVRPSEMTRLKIALLVLVAFILIIAIGIFLARRITAPLLRVVHASARVARGDFTVTVKPVGTDELALLARSFNYMVARLREGLIYRDLLGRTLSPEVRDQFRQSLAGGNLRLEGQNIVATILMSDIRGFTPLSEKTDPITVWAWLNEYFGELVPIITAHGGVVSEYIGDALLVFFGILPTPQLPEESAYRACQTALAMLTAIDQINARRIERGEPPLITGIGVNTGLVTAGSIGTADRMRYGVVGDTVNTTQRLESFTRQFGASSIVVSAATVAALQQRQGEFLFEDLGAHQFKGKSAPFAVYRLHPTVPVISPVIQDAKTG